MRKILLILLFAGLLPIKSYGAWTLVQSAAFTSNSVSGGDTKVTYGSNVTSGNLLLCFYTQFNVVAGATTISDTLGNVWNDVSVNTSTTTRLGWVVNSTTGADTVEVKIGNFVSASCAEYSGETVSGVVVDQVSSQFTGTTSVSPTILLPSGTPGTGDLLVEFLVATSSSSIFGTFVGGFTAERNVTVATTDQAVWADNTSSSGGTVTAGATAAASSSCFGIVASFIPAGATAQTNLGYVRPSRFGIKTAANPASGSVYFTGGNSVNDTILLFATEYIGPGSDKITGVTDTAGNTYTRIASASTAAGTLGGWTAVYAVNRCGGIATQNTITAQVSGLSDALELFAIEFAGGYKFDTSQAINTTTGATVSGTVTAAGSGELLATSWNVSSQQTPTNVTSTSSTVFTGGYAAQSEQVTGFLTPSLSGSNTVAASTSEGGYNFGIGSLTVALIPSAPSAGGGHAVVF